MMGGMLGCALGSFIGYWGHDALKKHWPRTKVWWQDDALAGKDGVQVARIFRGTSGDEHTLLVAVGPTFVGAPVSCFSRKNAIDVATTMVGHLRPDVRVVDHG